MVESPWHKVVLFAAEHWRLWATSPIGLAHPSGNCELLTNGLSSHFLIHRSTKLVLDLVLASPVLESPWHKVVLSVAEHRRLWATSPIGLAHPSGNCELPHQYSRLSSHFLIHRSTNYLTNSPCVLCKLWDGAWAERLVTGISNIANTALGLTIQNKTKIFWFF